MSVKKPATIKDVAEIAGVSTKSVSRVINNQPGLSSETRQRVQDAIKSLGYVANPSARRLRGSSNVIGLVVPNLITTGYIGQIVQGVSEATRRLGYNLILYIQNETTGYEESVAQYESLILSGMTDGLLMIVPHNYQTLIELCTENDLPYVLTDWRGREPEADQPTVTTTNRRGALDAMRHLLALGHRRIAHITGVLDSLSAQERLQGYRDALDEVDIAYDPALVVEGTWGEQSGFQLAQTLLDSHPRPSAIFAANDDMAIGAMHAAKERGLQIGADLSVVGFDDIVMASLVYPPLTTVRQPMLEMGEAAAELLVSLLREQTPLTIHRQFATELIIRESTGRPAQAN